METVCGGGEQWDTVAKCIWPQIVQENKLEEMNKLNGEKPHNALYIISLPKWGDAF